MCVFLHQKIFGCALCFAAKMDIEMPESISIENLSRTVALLERPQSTKKAASVIRINYVCLFPWFVCFQIFKGIGCCFF